MSKKTATKSKAIPRSKPNYTTEKVEKEKSLEVKYTELKSLSEALVREVDNIYSSPLKDDHRGQLLGSVIKSFADQIEKL